MLPTLGYDGICSQAALPSREMGILSFREQSEDVYAIRLRQQAGQQRQRQCVIWSELRSSWTLAISALVAVLTAYQSPLGHECTSETDHGRANGDLWWNVRRPDEAGKYARYKQVEQCLSRLYSNGRTLSIYLAASFNSSRSAEIGLAPYQINCR